MSLYKILKNSFKTKNLTAAALIFTASFSVTTRLQARAKNDINLTQFQNKEGKADNVAFAEVVKELALVLTPMPTHQAKAAPIDGFDLTLQFSLHGIQSQQQHWLKARTRFGEETEAQPTEGLQNFSLGIRKGVPLPIPLSSEFAATLSWIAASEMFSITAESRVALLEGFTWLPDFAIGIALSRMVGAHDFDLTTATFKSSISKSFVLFDAVELSPIFHYESIFYDAQSRLLLADPNHQEDLQNTFRFTPIGMIQSQSDSINQCQQTPFGCYVMNRHDRFTLGLQARMHIFKLGVFGSMTPLAGRQDPFLKQFIAQAGFEF